MKETDTTEIKGTPQGKSFIKIIGVGGGGGNAVNYMFREGIHDVSFALCNTDCFALNESPIPVCIQLRPFRHPKWGQQAAEESESEIRAMFNDGTKLSLIIACMGGETGIGAGPVIARISKEIDILTIGIVTIPFEFEGSRKIVQAMEDINEMAKHVDSLIVINNEHLHEIYPEMSVLEAFEKADETIYIAAKGIAEVITKRGLINIEYNDVKTIFKDSGITLWGVDYGDGKRAVKKT